ncbi:HAD family hydrolase [Microbacterium amylolyticum]|uniref:HAD superfamily hydrolase (TIGR01509 family) n=1 Tax=Microbacterium amylolyticum TaxID=936337 RepID=A0ABS4ZDQ2_9MICO|nr:HAD family phosphatase [Microbacterium amylolyticum]MBP2435417.1 HAD superfamily hydrolase (TIGR01509 family) [Microbacterium amylolyticum]
MSALVISDGAGGSFTAHAVVFDCDGILVDSESVWLRLISECLAELPDVDADAFHGLSVDDTARVLAAHTGQAASDVRIDLVKTYSDLLRPGVEPMPGAVELMTHLAAHIPVAVASNGLRHDVNMMLKSVGLLDIIPVIRTLEDVPRGKPAPDLYLAAAHALGTDPRHIIALEDSPAGATAARTAGMTVLGVNADPRVALTCDARFASLVDITARIVPETMETRTS